jgi:leucyl aminopeptidase
MEHIISRECPKAQAYIVPFVKGQARCVHIADAMDEAIDIALAGDIDGGLGAVKTLTMPSGGELASVILVGMGSKEPSVRELHTKLAGAYKEAKKLGAKEIAVLLDQVPYLASSKELFIALARLPQLVGFNNNGHKSHPSASSFEKVTFVTAVEASELEACLNEAVATARGTIIARQLCNMRASEQTPLSLAGDAAALGKEYGFEVEVFEKDAIEALGMDCYLSVARGAKNTPPALIVMRYLHGGDAPRIGLVGKGIVYDSGGYSIKTNAGMKNMFDDMGGGAAVIGAMTTIASMGLKANVIGVIAACENKVSEVAYEPGDIVGSMSGKSIEVLNTDAEGRLTLADAVTYIQRKEGCTTVADIATLTGAAKGAVGKFTAAVLCTDDKLFDAAKEASRLSAEKIWRLEADPEMIPCLNSPVADIKNTGDATTDGGGCMLGGLFVGEFIENNNPWLHIDMAPVNFRTAPPAYGAYGATGYGSALLYNLVKQLEG